MNEPTPEAQLNTEPPSEPSVATPPDSAPNGPSEEGALKGNPLRWRQGGALLAIGSLVSILLMALDRQLRWAVPLGVLTTCISAWGVLDILGSFDDTHSQPKKIIRLADLVTPKLVLAASVISHLTVIGLSAQGYLPIWVSAIFAPLTFVFFAYSLFKMGQAMGAFSNTPSDNTADDKLSFSKHHGFWLITIAAVLYLPMLGRHSLTDPWETHYGEVSREILSRNDWISLWWAQDGWFWSKPILDFWLQALSMSLFGVDYHPDRMLAANSIGNSPWPEWAVRWPVAIFSILAVYVLYRAVAHVYGKRAGFLGGLVLLTMPQWAFLTHQTMTDMPFVAPMAIAMGLLLLGIHHDPEQKVALYELNAFGRSFRLSAFHLVFGAVLLASLPQIYYLFSRNIEIITLPDADQRGFRIHADAFWSGSRSNCGLPGNEACAIHRPVHAMMQPFLQAGLWSALLGVLLYLNWGERRISRLFFMGAFFFAALSTMAKGPAGVVLPVLCVLAYVVATGRWRDLSRIEFASGFLIMAIVALPWYAAMYVRHGSPFIDRLIFHDMWKRALTHVHDTNEGDDVSFRYYLWQLGYALFPWIGLAPTALVWWARRPDNADKGKGDVSVFLALWFVFAFALFTAMLTKFHHYIFPAVPPAAMLIGIWLDSALKTSELGQNKIPIRALIAGAISVALFTLSVALALPGAIDGVVDVAFAKANPILPGTQPIFAPYLAAPQTTWAAIVLVPALALMGYSFKVLWTWAAPRNEIWDPNKSTTIYESMLVSVAAVAGGVWVLLVGRDLVVRIPGDTMGAARLLHLFTYNYKRIWPEALDFAGPMTAFTIVATLVTLLWLFRRFRPLALVSLGSVAICFTIWSLDVFFVRTSPHWGQREIIESYYKNRRNAEEPLVAFQMNWKGENFYSGNRLPAFVTTGENFKTWLKQQRERGVNTFYFATEHGRIPSLKNEIGPHTEFTQLTDKTVNNKFTVIRVVYNAE